MSFYVTTPFSDNRAVISTVEPTDDYFIVDKIPEGDGVLMVENGKLIRYNYTPPEPTPNPIEELQKEVKELEDVVDILMEGLV